MAKANAQWKEFFDDEVIVVFAGPHAYGVPAMVSDKKRKYDSQRRLVADMDPQWLPKFDALNGKYIDMMLDGIVNFEIPVARLETRWKLSQNRGRREMELIAEQLAKSDDSAERALSARTRKHLTD